MQLGQRDILSRIKFQADSTQLVRSTGANVLVMVLPSPQKSRPLESDHKRHDGVWIAIEYSYKKAGPKHGQFLQRQSQ